MNQIEAAQQKTKLEEGDPITILNGGSNAREIIIQTEDERE